jgi:ABC-2 type transport system permease protein
VGGLAACHPEVHGGGELMMVPAPPPTTPMPPTTPDALGQPRRLEVVRTFLRVGILNELQYRVNLVLQLFQSVVALATAIAVIALVFLYTPDLAGWSAAELLIVVGIHTMLGGVIRAVIQPNMQLLMDDIREGKLDFVLTKPVDAQLVVSVRRVTVWPLVDVLVGLGVVVVGVGLAGRPVTLVDGAIFLTTTALGAVMIYCLWLMITIGAFWMTRMEQVAELFNGLYQAGRWPVSIYPSWLRLSFTVLVPLAFAITVPAEALTGRAGIGTLGTAAAFTAVLVVLSRLLWRRGLRAYAGASA